MQRCMLSFWVIVSVCMHLVSADILWKSENQHPPSFVHLLQAATYINNSIQLVSDVDQVGAMWWQVPQTITNGFEVTIEFTVGPNNIPPTNFSFVLQSNSLNAIGSSTKGGFDFADSFAIETGISYVGIYGTTDKNTTTLREDNGDNATQGGSHTLTIIYNGQKIIAKTNDIDVQVNMTNFTFANYLNLINGTKAYIGFTASSGSRSTFNPLIISSMNFTNNENITCGENNCTTNSICVPNEFSYDCICRVGYITNGLVCSEPPGVPSNLYAEKGAIYLNFIWNEAIATTNPILYYSIECFIGDNTSSVILVNTTNATSYWLDDVIPGTRYYCRVRAHDTFDNPSAWTSKVEMVTHDVQPPGQTSPSCHVNGSTIRIDWTEATAGTYPISNYTVYFLDPIANSEIVFTGPENRSLVFTNMTFGVVYLFSVSVFDEKGFTSPNQTIPCNIHDAPRVLSTPELSQSLTVHGNITSIMLSWSAASSDQCEYILEFAVEPMQFKQLNKGIELKFTFEVFFLPKTYYFRVQAINNANEKSDYSTVVKVDAPGCLDGFCNYSYGENASTCPEDCANPTEYCTHSCNNGICQHGVCVCNSNYSYFDCSIKPEKSVVELDSTKPVIHIKLDTTMFELEILEIAEIERGEKLSQHTFKLADHTILYDAVNSSYYFRFPNKANMSISGKVYDVGTTIYWAQQNISIASNTLKISLTVQNWNFISSRNFLQISLRARPLNDTACANAENQDSGGQWTTTQSGIYTFFGKFAKNALIDGRAAQVTTDFDNEAHLALLKIPHFWQEAVLDPDYSVLVRDDPQKDPCQGGKNKVGLYVGIALAVLAVAIAVLVVGHLMRAKRKKEFEGKMKRAKTIISAEFVKGEPEKGDPEL